MKGTLVKWDAAKLEVVPNPWWKAIARKVCGWFGKDVYEPQYRIPDGNPADHAACIEVMELNEGQEPVITHRRQA